jgi:hypothetical protein
LCSFALAELASSREAKTGKRADAVDSGGRQPKGFLKFYDTDICDDSR